MNHPLLSLFLDFRDSFSLHIFPFLKFALISVSPRLRTPGPCCLPAAHSPVYSAPSPHHISPRPSGLSWAQDPEYTCTLSLSSCHTITPRPALRPFQSSSPQYKPESPDLNCVLE